MARAQASTALPIRLFRAARRRIALVQAAMRTRAVESAIEAGGALDGKIALITGAGRGIGLAIARAFARAGAVCIILTLENDEAEAVRAAFAAEGLRAEVFVLDVSDIERTNAAAAQIAARYPRIDILVNNAGVFFEEDRTRQATAIDAAMIARTLAVNVMGVIHVTSAFLHLIPPGGRIINVSSVMGLESHKADGRGTAYRMSKASVNSYTRSLAAELEPRGIMVDAFHPGWVKTILGGPEAQIEPEESVGTAFFLATRRASRESGLFWRDYQVVQ